MRSRTVLSLIQLSESIGSRRLAKVSSQEQIKRSAWSLSRVAGGGFNLGVLRAACYWAIREYIISGALTDAPREFPRSSRDIIAETSWTSSPLQTAI